MSFCHLYVPLAVRCSPNSAIKDQLYSPGRWRDHSGHTQTSKPDPTPHLYKDQGYQYITTTLSSTPDQTRTGHDRLFAGGKKFYFYLPGTTSLSRCTDTSSSPHFKNWLSRNAHSGSSLCSAGSAGGGCVFLVLAGVWRWL